MKKILAVLLTFILMLTAFPAMADNTRTSGPYTYAIKGNGSVTIVGFDWGKGNSDVYIPNMLDGYTVTAIGDNAFACEKQRSDRVNVQIPDTIKSIGNLAFANANIASINITTNLQHIGGGAFMGCDECAYKIAPNHPIFTVMDKALYNKKTKELMAFNYSIWPDQWFIIPEGILSIGDYAFYGNRSNGMHISLPSTLEHIGDYAFYGVAFSVESKGFFGNNLISIGDYAFSEARFKNPKNGQAYRMEITLPDSFETLGVGAFASFGNNSVGYTPVSLTIPSGAKLTEIPDRAFHQAENFFVGVACKINKVGEYAFLAWSAFGFSCATDAATDIAKYGFGDLAYAREGRYCSKSKVGSYYNTVAEKCDNLMALSPQLRTIPEYFNVVGRLPDTVQSISGNAYDIVVTDFYIPESITEIEEGAFRSGSTFVVHPGSYAELWCSENGFAYTYEGQEDDLSWLN